MEETPQQPQPQQAKYTVPALPAYGAAALFYTKYWMVPYWIVMFLIALVKDRLLQDGMAGLDWFFLFIWIPAEWLSIYYGLCMIRLPNCSYFWIFVLCSACSIVFTVYLIGLANVILFFEEIISVITLIIEGVEFLWCFIVFFIQRRPARIQPQ